ncbi:MAG: TetR family transcriptional regulator [Desulfobacterales bacterium]
MSMRKLAGRLKMTAANIYNYYQNKDDLYLAIQTRGFRCWWTGLNQFPTFRRGPFGQTLQDDDRLS